MGQKEKRAADKRHYVLIGYVAICVMLIFVTLFLSFTADIPPGQVVETATRTRSPMQQTLDADYATIAPTQQGQGVGEQPEAVLTPTRSGS